ncbi:MAG: YIP1 family protein [Paracoccaceae bacterium]|nr:YIP1 family protein [Paracoccaceae bacterium]
MTFQPEQMLRLCWQGLTSPREGAHAVLALGVPRAALWPLTGLIAVTVGVLMLLQGLILGPAEVQLGDETIQPIRVEPLILAFVIYLFVIGYAWALATFGQRLGGTGTFEESLALMIFLQMIMIGFQLAELVALIILPPLAGMIAIGGFFVGLWLNLQFVDVLHGFGSLMKSFLLMIAVSAAFAIALMFLITLIGGARIAG